jgi:LysM repeat protein
MEDSEQPTDETTEDGGEADAETDTENTDSQEKEENSDDQETEGVDEVLYGEIVSQAEVTDSDQSEDQNGENASDTIDTASQGYSTHVVKSGETVYEISIQEYGDASMADGIKELNNLDDNYSIVEGEELLLP